MNIYLDIDGVLIDQNDRAADYADEFLQFVLTHWPTSTYWLSIHSRNGQNKTYDLLQPYLRKKTLKDIHLIKSTNWEELKTEAIDFKRPFLWFDTQLYKEEQAILDHYQARACYRHIDLRRDSLQLLDELVYVRSLA